MKKAQISQVSIIIFSLIIIVLVVVFATKGISGILKDKCNADLLKFNVDMKNAITQNKDYGVVQKHLLIAPCDYYQVCFIDSTATKAELQNVDTGSDDLNKFLIAVTDTGEVLKNVFLFDGNLVSDSGFIPELRLTNDRAYLCIYKKAAKFTFITQGQGRYTNLLDVTDVE